MEQSSERLRRMEGYVQELKDLRPRVAQNPRLARELERSIEIGEGMIARERALFGSLAPAPETEDGAADQGK